MGPVNIHCSDAFQREGERLVAVRALRQPDAGAFEAHQPDSLVFLFMCRQHWRGSSQWQLQCTPLERAWSSGNSMNSVVGLGIKHGELSLAAG